MKLFLKWFVRAAFRNSEQTMSHMYIVQIVAPKMHAVPTVLFFVNDLLEMDLHISWWWLQINVILTVLVMSSKKSRDEN